MVRNYVRKTKRQSWTLGKMQSAISAVKHGISKCSASREYGVPKKTLLRYLSKASPPSSVSRFGSFSSVFTEEQEEELMEHLLFMSECYYGLTPRDVRSLAFELAELNGIPHPFKASERLAGYDWLKNFLKRHPGLTLRSAENTSLARATGFNRDSIHKFYDLLEDIFKEHQYPAHRIYNIDETGFSTVQTKPPKIVAKKGQHQVAGISSSERGVNTTVVMAMSASGEFVPPMFIFARQRMNDALKVGAPEGSVFACNPSGWSSIKTCVEWFDHFLAYTQPTADSPVLLILDGHSTHTRNLQMLEKAKRNFVRIVSIPPHTSHKVQPLDVTMMGPLKSHYATAMGDLLKQNPGKAITPYNISALVNQAFVRSASVKVAQNGFRATGIHPFNRSIVTDIDFAAADFLQSTKDDSAQLAEEPINHPSVNSNDQAENETSIVNCDSNSNAMPIDHIDENEYYVIRSNGDIIVGQILNLEYSFTEQQTEHNPTSETEHNPVNESVALFDNASADATYQKRSLSIAGQNDDDVLCQMHDGSQEFEENRENVPSVQPETKKRGTRKKRMKDAIKDQSVKAASDVSTQQIKKRRWDYNLDRHANDDATKPKKFMISPGSVAKRLEKPVVNRRKKSGMNREVAVELTSSPHRKKLVESTALKNISNIRKAVRKRTNRKTKTLITNDVDDVLCFTCGETFSASVNGNGWSKCISCQEWFHVSCAENMDECDACG